MCYTDTAGVILMGKKEKLIARLLSEPKDFTFAEATSLLEALDYAASNKGKTSGSRVMFRADGRADILLHRPHPANELKAYQVRNLIDILQKEGLV